MKVTEIKAKTPLNVGGIATLALDDEVTVEAREITIKVLEPDEGMMLTQRTLREGEVRVLSSKVYLAQGSTEDEWTEVTAEENDN